MSAESVAILKRLAKIGKEEQKAADKRIKAVQRDGTRVVNILNQLITTINSYVGRNKYIDKRKTDIQNEMAALPVPHRLRPDPSYTQARMMLLQAIDALERMRQTLNDQKTELDNMKMGRAHSELNQYDIDIKKAEKAKREHAKKFKEIEGMTTGLFAGTIPSSDPFKEHKSLKEYVKDFTEKASKIKSTLSDSCNEAVNQLTLAEQHLERITQSVQAIINSLSASPSPPGARPGRTI